MCPESADGQRITDPSSGPTLSHHGTLKTKPSVCLIKKTNNESSCEDVNNIYTLLEGMQTSQAIMEISIEVPQKLKAHLPCDPDMQTWVFT